MQPTRVTAHSATLIDQIYINDIKVGSTGGNITSSLSDHFPQFCLLDIFNKKSNIKSSRYGRSYKNFNHDEFKNELRNIQWDPILHNKTADESFTAFFCNHRKSI